LREVASNSRVAEKPPEVKRLFNRERQRLVITEAGREYLTVVRDALDRIALGTERLLNRASMVIDAAINGQGIALARTTFPFGV